MIAIFSAGQAVGAGASSMLSSTSTASGSKTASSCQSTGSSNAASVISVHHLISVLPFSLFGSKILPISFEGTLDS